MPRRYVAQVSEEGNVSVFMVEVILKHTLPSSFCIRDRLAYEDLVEQETNLDNHLF